MITTFNHFWVYKDLILVFGLKPSFEVARRRLILEGYIGYRIKSIQRFGHILNDWHLTREILIFCVGKEEGMASECQSAFPLLCLLIVTLRA